MSAPNHPCPSCGKETKVMHDPAMRICSVCRKVALAKDCTPKNAPAPRKDPSLDTVATSEEVKVGLEAGWTPPNHPCPTCQRETKEAGRDWRSCRWCKVIACQGCGTTDLEECRCSCLCGGVEDFPHLLSCPSQN